MKKPGEIALGLKPLKDSIPVGKSACEMNISNLKAQVLKTVNLVSTREYPVRLCKVKI